MARPAGLEPAASRLEVSRSIQMSYGRALGKPPFPVGSALARVNCEAEQGGNTRHRTAHCRHSVGHKQNGPMEDGNPRTGPVHNRREMRHG